MDMFEFIGQMLGNPMLLISTILTLGVILVNGWTDAPNAIATCVSTKAIGDAKSHYHGGNLQLPWRFRHDRYQ